MLDKFIGDAIMPPSGFPRSQDYDEDPRRAAASPMVPEPPTMEPGSESARGQSPSKWIGLNTDMVVSETSARPKRTGLSGDRRCANLASNSKAPASYSAQILISENTFRRLRGTDRIRGIDKSVCRAKPNLIGVD